MAVLDLLGRRWVLRILWELRREPLTFRNLQARCDGMSPSVLNRRLAELRAVGIIRLDSARGYQLTDEARSLVFALAPLRDWAERWVQIPTDSEQPFRVKSNIRSERWRTPIPTEAEH